MNIKPLKYGPTNFLFPDNTDNVFHGCSANSLGPYTGQIINGLKCRSKITTFPHDHYNENNYPWKGEIIIISYSPVLTHVWSDKINGIIDSFYLVPND